MFSFHVKFQWCFVGIPLKHSQQMDDQAKCWLIQPKQDPTPWLQGLLWTFHAHNAGVTFRAMAQHFWVAVAFASLSAPIIQLCAFPSHPRVSQCDVEFRQQNEDERDIYNMRLLRYTTHLNEIWFIGEWLSVNWVPGRRTGLHFWYTILNP